MEHEPVQRLRDVTPTLTGPTRQGMLSRIVGRFLIRAEAPERDGLQLPGLEGERRSGLAGLIATAVVSYRFSFIALVVVPSLVATLYLAFVASDQYAAEARFAVRSAQFETAKTDNKSISASVGLGGSIPAMAGQDAYVIASYIRSAAVFADLPPNLDPRLIYSRPEADFWARLSPNARLEKVTDYWRSMVTTYVDGPSGVVTVSVRAFRPQDARDLTAAVVAASERLVNAMSERARRDAMREAETEVKRTEGLVLAALRDERAYRDRQGWVDPGSQATSTSTLLMQAMAERIKLQNDYFVDSRAMSPDAPTVVTLKARLDVLDGQIDGLRAQLTSSADDRGTVSASIAQFEELELKRIFAEKLYSLSQEALERARLRAERQNVYISVFAPSLLPEEAQFPERWSLSAIIFVSLLAIWGILALTAATVADHTY
jgi:capsular polysaccharide transport system permease protein